MLFLTVMSSTFFMLLKHPVSMGSTLLIQTILISMITGMFNLNFWFSYILFLIMVGGLLILFIYMTSIASNEKFSYSIKNVLLMFTIIMLFMMMKSSDKLILDKEKTNQIISENHMNWIMSLTKMINYPQGIITMTLMIYLFITLIAVVKITCLKSGPLRQH
uniref:NADH-ubiquinone oxidoreductase chain 6 n=1 Tax=Endelus continentalis TaxID=2984121 RepID=A0A977XW61_9COLE|nr:NADH dehydrogenase subunit 6 [Endelus continentalis]UXX50481.1 NADH dehydrogenase subunit 6 [Endelus continentalis]